MGHNSHTITPTTPTRTTLVETTSSVRYRGNNNNATLTSLTGSGDKKTNLSIEGRVVTPCNRGVAEEMSGFQNSEFERSGSENSGYGGKTGSEHGCKQLLTEDSSVPNLIDFNAELPSCSELPHDSSQTNQNELLLNNINTEQLQPNMHYLGGLPSHRGSMDQNLGNMESSLLASTSTDLGFVSGHFSGHESSMERSLMSTSQDSKHRDPFSAQFEQDLNSNTSASIYSSNQSNNQSNDYENLMSFHEDYTNGNVNVQNRNRHLSNGSVIHRNNGTIPNSDSSATIKQISTGSSPPHSANQSYRGIMDVSDHSTTSFDATKATHSTPTSVADESPGCGDDSRGVGEDSSIFDRLQPRSSAIRPRPPSAPLSRSAVSRRQRRCYSSDVSTYSGKI